MKFSILNHFPIAKVFLKPLVFDPMDQSYDNLLLQKRIGAFEIQICAKIGCKKKSDVNKKTINHLKLSFFNKTLNIIKYLFVCYRFCFPN